VGTVRFELPWANLLVEAANKELPKPVAAIGLGKLLRAKACSHQRAALWPKEHCYQVAAMADRQGRRW
jgi:hypothetical protein